MAAWGYGLLGPVEVRVDGRAVPLPGARQRLVLTLLLVDVNRMVPASRLIDELWEAALPADPRGALRTQVSRLRRALGPAGGDLATVEGGYCLTVQRGQLDAARFEDMLAEAARAGGEQALGLVDEALALWRGPAVSEFADRPFALATAARLDELRLVAAERRAELLLIAGLAEEAAATLQALLAEHPEREQARGLLMQALYRAGRRRTPGRVAAHSRPGRGSRRYLAGTPGRTPGTGAGERTAHAGPLPGRPPHRSPVHLPVMASLPGRGTRAGPLTYLAADRTRHLVSHGRCTGYPP